MSEPDWKPGTWSIPLSCGDDPRVIEWADGAPINSEHHSPVSSEWLVDARLRPLRLVKSARETVQLDTSRQTLSQGECFLVHATDETQALVRYWESVLRLEISRLGHRAAEGSLKASLLLAWLAVLSKFSRLRLAFRSKPVESGARQ